MTTTPKKKTTTRKSRTLKASLPTPVPPVDSLPTNPFIFEILDLVNAQNTNAKKVEVLQNYDHESIKTIFVWNYDKDNNS